MNIDLTEATTLDLDLLRRYDKPGPRYTSYPTAPQFTARFDLNAYREHARQSNLAKRPLSIYFHVPYCFSPCFYCGCNRVITRDLTKAKPYVERLKREIDLLSEYFDSSREIAQLHMGGGTPNFLTAAQIEDLIGHLQQHFRFSDARGRDFSMEIDPRYVRIDDMAAYAQLGFNRMSLGVQDFTQAVQLAVNRIQSVEQTMAVIDACRANLMRSINVDLIYGLPKQTRDAFARTLDTVIKARPDRLAIYGYAHMPQLFKAQGQIEPSELPSAEVRLALLELAVEKLSAAGYRYIGMDHFALPTDDLSLAQQAGNLHRNFMGYTTHANTDLIGIGVSAISHIGASFSQNPRELPAWESAIDAGRLPLWRGMTLDNDDILRAEIIQQLMCHGAVNINAVEAQFGIDFAHYFASELKQMLPLVEDGIVNIERETISATVSGRSLLRAIAMCFDRYLKVAPVADARPAQYSKVI